MSKTIIYLIRHSEQSREKLSVDPGLSDQEKNEKIPLSPNGEILADRLSEITELKGIDTIYSSNYVRTISTAKYIALKNGLELNIDKRLGERKLRWFRSFKKAWRREDKRLYNWTITRWKFKK